MLGSYYYLATHSDWVYTSVYTHMQARSLTKLTQQEGFDVERLRAMEAYVKQLQEQVDMINGTVTVQEAAKEEAK